MRKLILFVPLLLCTLAARCATPSFTSFDQTQFSTNNLFISLKDGVLVTNINSIQTISLNGTNIVNLFSPLSLVTNNLLWTNIADILQPISGTNVMVTNFVVRGRYIVNTKSQLLDLGTNVIESRAYSQFILLSPTNDAAQVTLSLEHGDDTVQHLEIFNYTNGLPYEGKFTLPANSDVADLPGGFVKLLGDQDWVGTNGMGILLRFVSPDWIEIGRFNLNNGQTGASDGVWTNLVGRIMPIDGNVNSVLTFTSGLADNATNVAMVVNTTNLWSASGAKLLEVQNAGTNNAFFSRTGALAIGTTTESDWGPVEDGAALVAQHDVAAGDSDWTEIYLKSTGYGGNSSVNPYVFANQYSQTEWISNDGSALWRAKISVGQAAASGGLVFQLRKAASSYTYFSPAITSTGSAVAYLFDTLNTLTNGDTFVSIGNAGTPIFKFAPAEAANPAGQILFGPGTTNSLFRSDTKLVYTNGTTSAVTIEVRGGAAATAIGRFGVSSSANTLIEADTGRTIQFGPDNSSATYLLTSSAFAPSATGKTLGAGTASSQWNQLRLDGIIVWNGTTNTLYDGWTNSSPQSLVAARPGSIWRDAENGGVYVKASGTGNTGWHRLQDGPAEYLDSTETNDTTTPQNLSLSATVVTGLKYTFTVTLFVDNSTDADGVSIDFDGGSATMTDFRAAVKVFDSALTLSTQTTALATDAGVATLTGVGSVEVRGAFIPSGDGTFIPRFFMTADTGGTLSVFQGSNLVVTQAQ